MRKTTNDQGKSTAEKARWGYLKKVFPRSALRGQDSDKESDPSDGREPRLRDALDRHATEHLATTEIHSGSTKRLGFI